MWFPECPLFGGKNTLQKRFGIKDSVRCSEFRGGRFSEVANVLQVWDFQSVTRTLSALGSVSASRSVRSGRFYCNWLMPTHEEYRQAFLLLLDANLLSQAGITHYSQQLTLQHSTKLLFVFFFFLSLSSKLRPPHEEYRQATS